MRVRLFWGRRWHFGRGWGSISMGGYTAFPWDAPSYSVTWPTEYRQSWHFGPLEVEAIWTKGVRV